MHSTHVSSRVFSSFARPFLPGFSLEEELSGKNSGRITCISHLNEHLPLVTSNPLVSSENESLALFNSSFHHSYQRTRISSSFYSFPFDNRIPSTTASVNALATISTPASVNALATNSTSASVYALSVSFTAASVNATGSDNPPRVVPVRTIDSDLAFSQFLTTQQIFADTITDVPTPKIIDRTSHLPPTKKKKAAKKYKPVALKVKPVIGELPGKFRIIRNIIGDPLKDMPRLSTTPPPFTPTGRYNAERKEIIDKNHPGFLLPGERDLLHHFMMQHESAFAWDDSERGHFREDFFPPIDIPVVPHKPWVERNIHIPPGIYDDVCAAIRRKLDAGTFEPSNSSYRSRWFCVVKKDGKSLRLVQSL